MHTFTQDVADVAASCDDRIKVVIAKGAQSCLETSAIEWGAVPMLQRDRREVETFILLAEASAIW